MTPSEIIEVVSAFRDGKKVESRPRRFTSWVEDKDPTWNFEIYEYRVAREPRRVWLMADDGMVIHPGVAWHPDPTRPDWIEFVEMLK